MHLQIGPFLQCRMEVRSWALGCLLWLRQVHDLPMLVKSLSDVSIRKSSWNCIVPSQDLSGSGPAGSQHAFPRISHRTSWALLSTSPACAFFSLPSRSLHSAEKLREIRSQGLVLPVLFRLGVVLSHPAGRFCRPAFHSEHSSIPVHTSLLAGNCLPKIQPVIQSSQTLCLWWLKPQTLAQ